MFNIGDKVKIKEEINLKDGFYIDEMKNTIGEVGTIIRIEENDIMVEFEKPVGEFWHYRESDLELVTKVQKDETETKAEYPDLEIGDKITLRNGKEYIVTDPEGAARPIDTNDWAFDLEDYNDELQDGLRDDEYEKLEGDIMIVAKPEYKVTWTRTEKVRKMTRTEIEKILGYKYEIVEE